MNNNGKENPIICLNSKRTDDGFATTSHVPCYYALNILESVDLFHVERNFILTNLPICMSISYILLLLSLHNISQARISLLNFYK